MKIIFFGTDGIALKCLEALKENFEVALVVTVPDRPVGRKKEMTPSDVTRLAVSLGCQIYKPETLKTIDVEARLREVTADCFVVAVYGKIIPKNILNIPHLGCINVHPSLLPKYRGPSPIRTPLLYGDSMTGVSIIKMDSQVDHGPILALQTISIKKDDNNLTLTEKLAELAGPLLVRALHQVEQNESVEIEQDHSKATFTKMFSREDGKVDWEKSASEIYNQWRACQEWPGIYTTWNGKMLKIIECHAAEQTAVGKQDGEVLRGGLVVCGDGSVLQFEKLQLEGKQVMTISEFSNGHKAFVGSVLNKK